MENLKIGNLEHFGQERIRISAALHHLLQDQRQAGQSQRKNDKIQRKYHEAQLKSL